MTPNPNPPVAPTLVEHLDRVFPDRCPNVGDSEREIWMAVGARKVVEHLRVLADQQQVDFPKFYVHRPENR